MISHEFESVAASILAGDKSLVAAQDLEGIVLMNHLDDAAYKELLDALSLYAPGHERPYVGAAELRTTITRFLKENA